MSFDDRKNAKRYVPQDGDTLRTIAERETASGNPLTWKDIARFNWGTDDEATVNEYLRDELGARRRDADNNFVISSDDEHGSDLLIPVRFQKVGLALGKQYTLRVRRRVAPPQFLECCAIPGTTFGYDKSFIRPSVVEHLGELEQAVAKYPDARIMIFGHTDRVGTEAYNKALSERRARSVYAFIIDDVDTWEELFHEEVWGTPVIQEILKDFGDPAFDPGPADGVYGPKTEAAVRNYQEARGLTADGVAGPVTRRHLFGEYMTSKHDVRLVPDQFMAPRHMGCGEFNPVVATEGPHEANRRVTFFLFHPSRPPVPPCRHGDLGPCHRQMDPPGPRHVATFGCSFFDSLASRCPSEHPPVASKAAHIALRLRTNSGCLPVADTPYEIRLDADVLRGVTGGDGLVEHADVPSGDYELVVQGIYTVVPTLPSSTPARIHRVAGLHLFTE